MGSDFKVTKLISERKYRAGYIVRKELVDDTEYGGDGDLEMTRAYTPEGDWIGSSKEAYRYCKQFGITKFEKTSPDHCCVSIGFNPVEQKWYGWSHRAIYGFGIGSEVKKGHCGYKPTLIKDILDSYSWLLDRNDGECEPTSKYKIENGEFYLGHLYTIDGDYVEQDEDGGIECEDGMVSSSGLVKRADAPERWQWDKVEAGRGEWTAKTLEDAKQMAIDFSDGVS